MGPKSSTEFNVGTKQPWCLYSRIKMRAELVIWMRSNGFSKKFQLKHKWFCVSVYVLVCIPDCCSVWAGLAVPQPVWSSRTPLQTQPTARKCGKIKAQNTYMKNILKYSMSCKYLLFYFLPTHRVCVCMLSFFCASSFWLAEIYFLLKTFCCKQWKMAKQTLQLSAGKLNLFLLKSIELISVEEVSNFQMQTANLCESSAFSTAAAASSPPVLALIYLLSFGGARK